MSDLRDCLLSTSVPASALPRPDESATEWVSSPTCSDREARMRLFSSLSSTCPVGSTLDCSQPSICLADSICLSPSSTSELLKKLGRQLDELMAAAPTGFVARDRAASTPCSTMSYDEAKAVLAAAGARPCPSAKENEELFKLRSRGLPAPAWNDKAKPDETRPTEEKSMLDTMFNGICGRIKPGNCRLGYTGGVAIRTSDGTYKTYNLKTGQLTNCDRFVFDVGDDLFMMVPTRKLRKGDIVLFGGKPKCVIENLPGGHVKVINYDTAVIEEVVPERHVFMGRRFYGKIVSLMGNGFLKGGKGGMFRNLLKFKLMSSVLGTGGDAGLGGLGNALPMMFMLGGGSLDGMFDFDGDDEDDGDDGLDGDEGFLGALLKDEEDKPGKNEAEPEKAEKAKEA